MPLELNRPRDLGQILSATFSLYGRYFLLFAAIALMVVVPVDALFYGIIGGRFGEYDATPPPGSEAIAAAGSQLIAIPLITGMHVAAVLAIGEGRQPTIGQTFERGAAKFAPLLLTVLLVGLLTLLGAIALIIGAIYVGVRLWVSTPAVVVEDRGPTDAIKRSWELVKDNWWRSFGIILLTSIMAGVASLVVAIPLEIIASTTESGPFSLLGQIIADTIVMSFQALIATLLFFDLRARHEGVPGWGGGGYAGVPGGQPQPYAPAPGGQPYAPPPPGHHPPEAPPPPGPERP